MKSMSLKYSSKKRYMSIILITVSIGLCATHMEVLINAPSNLLSAKAAQTGDWSTTFHITESGGAGNTVVIGATSNSSDGQDQNDLPEPPAPPQVPFLLTWFETPFPLPYNDLLHEYKSTSSNRLVWNLSILWMPESQNHSTTTIHILWNSTQVYMSGYYSFRLYENNSLVADMRIEDTFSYTTNSTVHRFQIIAQKISTNDTSEPIQPPIILIMISVSFGLIVVIAIVIIVHLRKNK
jgi:hypothetical protein